MRLSRLFLFLLPICAAMACLGAPHSAKAQSCVPSGSWVAGTFFDGHPLCAADLNFNSQTQLPANNILKYIPTSQWEAIFACTSTYDVSAAKATADAVVSVNTGSYTVGHGEVDWPAGCYYFATTYHQRLTVVERGVSTGLPAGGSTVWKWPPNTAGTYVETANANNCAPRGTGLSGAGYTLDGITLIGGGGTLDGTSHGFSACVMFNLINVSISNFAGDLVHIDTTQGGVADGWHITGGTFQGNTGNTRYGVWARGADSQTGTMLGSIIITTGGSCIVDQSFLGNFWYGITCEVAGFSNTAYANQGGASYGCLDTISTANCQNTTPGTNGSVWNPITFNASYPAYSSSIVYIIGSAYSAFNPNTRAHFLDDYCEGGDPPVDITGPSRLDGSLQGCGFTSRSVVTSVASEDANQLVTSTGVGGRTYNTAGTQEIYATVGGGAYSNGDVLSTLNTAINGVDRLRLHWVGNDLRWDWFNADATDFMYWCSSETVQQFGSGANQPNCVFFPKGFFLNSTGSFASGRFIGCDTAAPTIGAHAAGEFVFNCGASAIGQPLGWSAITSGTPGAWVATTIGANVNLATANHFTGAQQFDVITNGTGVQAFNSATTCTTGSTVGAVCTTGAITLPVAYSDTNYRLTCTGLSPTNVPTIVTDTKSNTTFTITIAALTAAAATFASYDCIAVHN